MIRFLVFHYWLKFESNHDICQIVATCLNVHNFKKRKRKPNANDVSRMTAFKGATPSGLAKMILVQNEIDTYLPTIQALVHRQGIQSNTIPGKLSNIKNQFPRKQSVPNLISRNVQQATRIVMLNQNKFPREPNTIPGRRSIIENQFPGRQSGPNLISRKVQQATGIVMPNQNKFPGEPNTIPGRRSIIKNKFPGKQSVPNSISRKVQQPTGIVIPNQNKFPGEPNMIPGKRSISIKNEFPGKQNGNTQEQQGDN